MSTLRFSNPKSMPPPRGYTMVVEATGPGRTVYIAGQLGMTPAGREISARKRRNASRISRPRWPRLAPASSTW